MLLRTLTLLCLLLTVCGSLFPAAAGTAENSACRYLKNYNREDYGFAAQNWVVLQDRQGIIYAANSGGLLDFDGVHWGGVKLEYLRSLAIDSSGTIYVGGLNEIGFIASRSNGSLFYVSLIQHLDKKERNFSRVMKTHTTKEGVYFRTSQFLFRWHPASQKMKTWHPLVPNSGFAGSFVCRGRLFVRHKKVGLMQMKDDKLQPVPGGELFAAMSIYAMFPYDEQDLVIGTREKGLYLYDGEKMAAFPTEVDDYLKEKQLSYGARLKSSPGHFALSTLRGGLLVIDSRGRLQEIFTRLSGLQDDNVKYVFEDSRGNLWLALESGISKIEYASPLSFYNAGLSALPGFVLSVTRHEPGQDLYAGTTWGLFVLEPDGKFRKVPGITTECFSLLFKGDSLLAATNRGLFYFDTRTKDPQPREIITVSTYFLQPSRQMPGYIWARTSAGLFLLYKQKERWQVKGRFENLNGDNSSMAEDEKGNLWLGTRSGRVIKVKFTDAKAAGKIPGFEVIPYDYNHGLPAEITDPSIDPFWVAGHTVFAAEKGIYRFDEKQGYFFPDYTLGDEFAGGGTRAVSYLVEDSSKDIWFYSLFENFRATPGAAGSYLIDRKNLLRLPEERVNTIYPDPGGNIIWFAGNRGLFRFDKRIKKNYNFPFRAVVREVVLPDNKTLIFRSSLNDSSFPAPRIDYENRNIRFKYAAPFFEDESSTRYQVFLEGYEKSWSEWTTEGRKDYVDLDAGFYTFRVRARNVYDNLSEEDTFQFKILPPWYRTWWAYAIYTLFLFLSVYVVVRWRSWKLEREKQQLEKIVKERTKEVYEKNILLEEQSEKLKEMDKMKSRFFANISHEFRTPLTLIMGPLEQVLSDYPHRDEQLSGSLNLALRSSRRLLGLINQLLDLSRLESGRMRLRAGRKDIISFVKGVVGSFESLAVRKKLDLTCCAEEEAALLYFDRGKIDKVIGNLVANAVKFTPAGGKVAVTAAVHSGRQGNFPGGYIKISVRDTGIGIPKDQLPYIFDRFYQAGGDPAHGIEHKGSGIGLALVKELVHLHHGEITVKSEVGKGSEFSLLLPLGAAHLKPDEILADSESLPPEQQEEIYETSSYHSYINEEVDEAEEFTEQENAAFKEDSDMEEDLEKKDVILVVEDNPDVRKYIRGALQAGYTVVEAVDGRQGIDKARKIIPDLIISDIMMPAIDGYQLCNVLKKDVKTSHIPIILLTARASEESIIAGLKTGADDYITKPFNTNILLTRIKNLIDLRRQLQEKIQREMALQPTAIAVSSVDQAFMKELKKALEKNLSCPEFGVDELAKALYMGKATLNRKIRAITGESTNRFIQSYRLKRAAQLLKENFGNVTEVSFEVGFSSSGYFTKCFKKKFHRLPHIFQAAGEDTE